MVAALAFILAAALLTYPLTAAGLSPLDAWFESVSGVTTTGLSMVTDPQHRSEAFLFARAWMQWFGGLGIVVLSLALAAGRPADMRRLDDAAGEADNLAQGVRIHARRVLAVYVLLTCLGLGLVWAAGLPPFQALVHTLAAVSTGGFSAFPDSLAGVSPWGQTAVLAVACLGALPLPLLYRAYLRGAGELASDPELRALVAAVLAAALLLWWLGQLTPAQALSQAVSAQTTTGFSTLDPSGLDPAAKWTLILSMVTGGGVGSTAGGVKLLRVLILIRVIQLAVLRVQMPRHAVIHPELGGRPLDAAQIEHALLLLLLYPLVIAALLAALPGGRLRAARRPVRGRLGGRHRRSLDRHHGPRPGAGSQAPAQPRHAARAVGDPGPGGARVSWHLVQAILTTGGSAMRFVFIGSGSLAILTGRMLAERGHALIDTV